MNPTSSHRSRFWTLLVLGSALTSALLACQKDKKPAEHPVAVAPGHSPIAKTRALTDCDVAMAIRKYMQEDRALRSEHVDVSVTDGIATVSGSVSNIVSQEHALSVAKTIRGVRSVIDRVTVTPIVVADHDLIGSVMSAIEHDVATRPYKVMVAAKDGVVTLSGTTDSWQQKNLFTDVTKTVPGVKAIDNAVVVRYVLGRPESEITTDVEHRLANDVWLDGDALKVTVTATTVHVTGVVGSAAEKSRAGSEGWVAGVYAVDDSGIVVDWSALDAQRHANDYPLRSDREIVQAVREAFRLDPRLKALVPQVASDFGKIVLSGTVDSPLARSAAEADARDTIGVWSVRDETQDRSAAERTDTEITRGVKRMLAEDSRLSDGKMLEVSTSKGKVALRGMLASGFERFDVIADAQRVPGVVEIVDDIAIARTPADVRSSIEDRLYWDPRLRSDQIQVVLSSDGVATLSGTVDSWGQLRAAREDTLRAGARRVVNALKLRDHPEVIAL